MIIKVKVRDLREGDKITTNNPGNWAWGVAIAYVRISPYGGVVGVYDRNDHGVHDGVISADDVIEVDRPVPTTDDLVARVRELLQPLYAQVLSDTGIDHGDVSPGELEVLEAAEDQLAAAVAAWVRFTLTVDSR